MLMDYTSTLPPPPTPPPGGAFLKVSGTTIINTNTNTPLLLRGCGLGGLLKMENFITGFPGHEQRHREAMQLTLGPDLYTHFFDRFMHHFFNEKDARFLASLGLNNVRIPFDYRHFEDDMDPMVLKPSGFKHLDRIITLCGKYGIYTTLDLHAAPGGHNPSWHSNNLTAQASFFEHKHFQDRAVWLWGVIAERYKDNPWVAGYNPLNKPADRTPKAGRLLAFYKRVEKRIREVDGRHILFWDANTLATDWYGFEELEEAEEIGGGGRRKMRGVFPNSAYSCHDYCYKYGFPGIDRYKGTPEQKQFLRENYDRKVTFMKRNNLCIWNGEFGPVYANPIDDGPEWEEITKERINMVKDQLLIYDAEHISWSLWLYKDIGFQGMVYTPPSSPYLLHIRPFLQKKRLLMLDQWGNRPQPFVEGLFLPLEAWVDENSPSAKYSYPPTWGTARHLSRAVRETFLAESLQGEFAGFFDGLGREELEGLLESFALREMGEGEGVGVGGGKGWAVQRGYLNEVLREHNGIKL